MLEAGFANADPTDPASGARNRALQQKLQDVTALRTQVDSSLGQINGQLNKRGIGPVRMSETVIQDNGAVHLLVPRDDGNTLAIPLSGPGGGAPEGRQPMLTGPNTPQPAPPRRAAPTGSVSGSSVRRGSGTVNVIAPDGTPGTIPAANLPAALRRGFKRAGQ